MKAAALACGAWLLAIGCSGGVDVSAVVGAEAAQPAGTLQIPLTASSPSGISYRLDGAVFSIDNPFLSPPVSLTIPADEDTLQVDLPPSAFDFDYTVFLQDGWQLIEVAADGTERSVGATLVSSNPLNFTVKAQRTTPLTYQFRASSGVVTTGDGAVAINVAVDDTLIDDFEDGDGQLVPIGGRNGVWFTFNDGSGVQTPAPGAEVLPEVLDASANFVLHTAAQGFAPQGLLPNGDFAFGVGVGTSPAIDPLTGVAVPYDASGYDGVSFSFTISFPPSTPIQLSFLIGTVATTPVAEGGSCTEVCYDDFGFVGGIPFSPFTFTGTIPWGALQQIGLGNPTTFDPATITTLKWIVAFPNGGQPASAGQFDFQLDNVSFTSGTLSTPFLVPAPVPVEGPAVPPFEAAPPLASTVWP
jgi:hypothetical protein